MELQKQKSNIKELDILYTIMQTSSQILDKGRGRTQVLTGGAQGLDGVDKLLYERLQSFLWVHLQTHNNSLYWCEYCRAVPAAMGLEWNRIIVASLNYHYSNWNEL